MVSLLRAGLTHPNTYVVAALLVSLAVALILGARVVVARRDPSAALIVPLGFAINFYGAFVFCKLTPTAKLPVALVMWTAFGTALTWAGWASVWALAAFVRPHGPGGERAQYAPVAWLAWSGVVLVGAAASSWPIVGRAGIGAPLRVLVAAVLAPTLTATMLAAFRSERIERVRGTIAWLHLGCASLVVAGTMSVVGFSWSRGSFGVWVPLLPVFFAGGVAVATLVAVRGRGWRGVVVGPVLAGFVPPLALQAWPDTRPERLQAWIYWRDVPIAAYENAVPIDFDQTCLVGSGGPYWCPDGKRPVLVAARDRPIGRDLERGFGANGDPRGVGVAVWRADEISQVNVRSRLDGSSRSRALGGGIVRLDAERFEVYGRSVGRSEIHDAIARAQRDCGTSDAALVAGPGWTAAEIVSLCRGNPRSVRHCTYSPSGPAPRSCEWVAGLGYITRCAAGKETTCWEAPTQYVVCDSEEGCSIVGNSGRSPYGEQSAPAPPLRVVCPQGGCWINALRAPVQLDCDGGGCIVYNSSGPVTWLCAGGGCEVRQPTAPGG